MIRIKQLPSGAVHVFGLSSDRIWYSSYEGAIKSIVKRFKDKGVKYEKKRVELEEQDGGRRVLSLGSIIAYLDVFQVDIGGKK